MQQNIKKWRDKIGITQEALAEHMEVSIPTVSRWETGVNAVNLSQLKKIAIFLHITVPQLLSDPEEIERFSDIIRIARGMDKETYDAWLRVGEIMKIKK